MRIHSLRRLHRLRRCARSRATARARVAAAAWTAALLLLGGSDASALSFQVDFTSTTYQVQAGDTWADLLAAHRAGALISANTLDGLVGISAPVLAGGTTTDYSLLMTTTVDVLVGGQYVFQVGTDWGRGGAAVVIDDDTGVVVDELVRTDDVWWNNDWSNPDVFTTTLDLAAGTSYTLGWVGFEGCCGGSATIRFSYEGSGFLDLDSANGDAFMASIPEPCTALHLALGLGALWGHGRRSRRDILPARKERLRSPARAS